MEDEEPIEIEGDEDEYWPGTCWERTFYAAVVFLLLMGGACWWFLTLDLKIGG